jgi:hypothetical protein
MLLPALMGSYGVDYFYQGYQDVQVCATLVEHGQSDTKDVLTLVYERNGTEERVSIEKIDQMFRVRAWRKSGGRVTQGIVDLVDYLPGLIMDIGSDESVKQFYRPLRELYSRSVN